MVRILHLIDETVGDDSLVTLRQLMHRLAAPTHEHLLGVVGPMETPAWAGPAGNTIHFGRRLGWVLASALPVHAALRDRGVQIAHAWSDPTAAIAQLAATGGCRIVVTVSAPPAARPWSRWWSAFGGSPSSPAPAIVCPSQLFFRRAIEAGIPTIRCGVIRPGVDFAAINAGKRSMRRESLGIAGSGPVLLTPPPPSRPGGHYHAVWATAVLQQIWPDVRIILPGVSRECRRLQRFAASFHQPDLVVTPGRRFEFEQLLAIADFMVVAAVDDVATGAIAWAMAAGVPIVASAVPAVAEYIADHQNGLLCKPGRPMVLASRIRTALQDASLMRRLSEAARGQAFEVFSVTRLIRQYRALYENVLHRRHPFEGITDAAVVA
jgi:glycosyltransferase involved in cell wall biosynthesis